MRKPRLAYGWEINMRSLLTLQTTIYNEFLANELSVGYNMSPAY
ncbi:hypothetical protein ACWATR_09115 [Nostoc sp. UIC 10890]